MKTFMKESLVMPVSVDGEMKRLFFLAVDFQLFGKVGMKTSLRVTIATLMLAVLSVSTVTVQGQGYTYITNNRTITITGYTGTNANVVIQATHRFKGFK